MSQEKVASLHTFVKTFHGCYRNGLTEGKDFRSMSGTYMLIQIIVVIANYHACCRLNRLVAPESKTEMLENPGRLKSSQFQPQ